MTLNRSLSFKLCLIAILLGDSVFARIYETQDAIIVEADRFDTERLGRAANSIETSGDKAKEFEYAFPEPLSVGFAAFPSGTFYLGDKTCWTPEGKVGICGSFRSCYPKEKLPSDEDDVATWISTRGTCQYREADGKQTYGVCCARDDATPPQTSMPIYPFMMPIGLSSNWWPNQYYPFAPSPVNFAPYPVFGQKPPSPAVPAPPFWVPQLQPVQQMTTSRPSTTTSPWWTPEATTTTASTTTSPWWTPETTTKKPSTTTSPWWTPEPTSSTSAWWTAPTTTKPRPAETAATKPTTTTTARPTPTTTKPRPAETPTTKPTTTTQSTTTSRTTTTTKTTAKPIPVTQPVLGSSEDIACGAGPFKTLSFDEQRRIVGGTNAPKNAWPFIVALFNGGRHFCGGSLIDKDHVLTAAHCVAHMSSSDVARLTIAIGMHTLKPADPEAVRVRAKRIVRHKGFDSRTLYNDVAIIQLETPATFSRTVSAVCLPPAGSEEKFVGRTAAVIGWGALREGGPQPSVLQQVTVEVQSNDECKRRYGKDAPGGIVSHMLCAAYPGKDSCSGDSGGPLIVQEAPGSPWVQAGVVSWGIGCGKPPYPGVYSRVTAFLDWINRNRA